MTFLKKHLRLDRSCGYSGRWRIVVDNIYKNLYRYFIAQIYSSERQFVIKRVRYNSICHKKLKGNIYIVTRVCPACRLTVNRSNKLARKSCSIGGRLDSRFACKSKWQTGDGSRLKLQARQSHISRRWKDMLHLCGLHYSAATWKLRGCPRWKETLGTIYEQ